MSSSPSSASQDFDVHVAEVLECLSLRISLYGITPLLYGSTPMLTTWDFSLVSKTSSIRDLIAVSHSMPGPLMHIHATLVPIIT